MAGKEANAPNHDESRQELPRQNIKIKIHILFYDNEIAFCTLHKNRLVQCKDGLAVLSVLLGPGRSLEIFGKVEKIAP